MDGGSEGRLLRFFVNEGDRREGAALYEWIVLKAREMGIARSIAFRAMMGFGTHRQVRSFRIFRPIRETPVVVELVDEQEKLESFLRLMDDVIKEGLATVSKADVRVYRWEDGSRRKP